jgi:hypothetical protein
MHSSEIRVFEDLFLGPREKGARPLHSEFGPVLCDTERQVISRGQRVNK